MCRSSDCFHVYDLNGDKYISREEMFHMLKDSLIRQPSEEDPDEGIKDLVEIILKKMVKGTGAGGGVDAGHAGRPAAETQRRLAFVLQDHDHDGRLSFADFEKSVKEENLLLEAFGTCLPDDAVKSRLKEDERVKVVEIYFYELITLRFCFLSAD